MILSCLLDFLIDSVVSMGALEYTAGPRRHNPVNAIDPATP